MPPKAIPLYFEGDTAATARDVVVKGEVSTLLPSLTGKPPYHPSKPPRYPPYATVKNVAYGSTAEQPVYAPIPAGMLCRPEWVRKDLSISISHGDVWIAVAEEDLSYMVAPSCSNCNALPHKCDRLTPCNQCQQQGEKASGSCKPGSTWQAVRIPTLKRKHSPPPQEDTSAQRLAANMKKPDMPLLRSVPVWAHSRAAMTSSLDYLRDPKPDYGGSVEVTANGKARAVILEGESQGYWGVGADAGTICVFIGGDAMSIVTHPLSQAQCARTPVAVIVGQDYSVLPYKLPRAYVVLGWFWIVDVWVEPKLGTKCRFEWCGDTPMWWSDAPRPKPLIASEQSWTVTLHPDTVRDRDNGTAGDGGSSHFCSKCLKYSEGIYAVLTCLNQHCKLYLDGISDTSTLKLRPARQKPRISPAAAGLSLRPRAPIAVGADYWRGFVCQHCGQASERTRWSKWECSNCLIAIHDRKILYTENLKLKRPVPNALRLDNGFAQIKLPHERKDLTLDDGVKVCRYVLGPGQDVFHAMSHEGIGKISNSILVDLQGAAIPFERKPVGFSMLWGAEGGPWKVAPAPCLAAVDLINARASKIWTGEQGFNSVSFHAMPPSSPTLTFVSTSAVCILVIGSDGRVTLRKKPRAERSDLTAQHGDVIGINSPLTIEIKLEGFGFVCVARQIYGSAAVEKKPKVTKVDLSEWYIGPFPIDK